MSTIASVNGCNALIAFLIPNIIFNTRFQFSWPKYIDRFFLETSTNPSSNEILSDSKFDGFYTFIGVVDFYLIPDRNTHDYSGCTNVICCSLFNFLIYSLISMIYLNLFIKVCWNLSPTLWNCYLYSYSSDSGSSSPHTYYIWPSLNIGPWVFRVLY